MKITATRVARHQALLAQPYEIAGARFDTADLLYLRLSTDKQCCGFGSASPMPLLTRETMADCYRALAPINLGWLIGRPVDETAELLTEAAAKLSSTPAARAALEMALHDLYAKSRGEALVDTLGRKHERLPTSVTIGITDPKQMLTEAQQWVNDGFQCLKVKVGRNPSEDITRITLLREKLPNVAIRVDANQGYSVEDTARFVEKIQHLNIEFCEQPFAATVKFDALRGLSPSVLDRIALDESIGCTADAANYATSPGRVGVINLKVMKLGFEGARRMAADFSAAGQALMWGCVDESIVGIAAALHLAYATATTRYLDLDGHIGLQEAASGGLTIEDGGFMSLQSKPGIGVHVDNRVFQ